MTFQQFYQILQWKTNILSRLIAMTLQVRVWFDHLNTSQTSLMLFSPQKMSIDIKFSLNIRGESINRTHGAKNFGLLIDEKLKFDVHIKHVCQKLSQICSIGLFCYL